MWAHCQTKDEILTTLLYSSDPRRTHNNSILNVPTFKPIVITVLVAAPEVNIQRYKTLQDSQDSGILTRDAHTRYVEPSQDSNRKHDIDSLLRLQQANTTREVWPETYELARPKPERQTKS